MYRTLQVALDDKMMRAQFIVPLNIITIKLKFKI